MKKNLFALVALALTLLCFTASAITGGDNQSLPGTDVKLPSNLNREWEDVTLSVVPYKTLEDGSQLRMILCIPADSANENPAVRPCIVYTRGSGLRAVTVEDFTARPGDAQLLRCIMLAKQGYVVAAVEFRGYTTEPQGSGTFPAALQDVRAAVRFLKASAAEYGIDKEKFGVMGQSSGGYEAAMVGVTSGAWAVEVPMDSKGAGMGEIYLSETEADAAIAAGKTVVKLDTAAGDINPDAIRYNSDVKAAIDFYGIAKIDEIGTGEFQHTLAANTAQEEVKFMTGSDQVEIWEAPYVHTAANPFWYIDQTKADQLSMLFVHGTGDNRVFPSNTENFYNLVKEHGLTAYRFLIPNAGHGGDRFTEDDTYTMVLDFFDETLKGFTGSRVVVCPSENGTVKVCLNGEDVTEMPWKLRNLTKEDRVTVEAVPAQKAVFNGLSVEIISSDYVVETKTVYTPFYEFTGDSSVIVTASFYMAPPRQ